MTADHSTVSSAGILMPELLPRLKGCSLEQLMRSFIESKSTSRNAKDFLLSASPSRARSDGSNSRLIVVEGHTFEKDLHTEGIKRFAKTEVWRLPSFEDALRLYPVMSFRGLAAHVCSVVVLHEPVRGMVLGLNNENGSIILTAHKVESRKKGWYCRNSGFVFRIE